MNDGYDYGKYLSFNITNTHFSLIQYKNKCNMRMNLKMVIKLTALVKLWNAMETLKYIDIIKKWFLS